MTAGSSATTPGSSTPRWREFARNPRALELLALIAVLVLLANLFSHSLDLPSAEFDEGVYLASAQALSRGAELGRDVFSSQPPLFYAGLGLSHALGAGDPAVMRLMSVLVALAGCLAGFVLVRTMAGPFAGLVAAAFAGMAFANNGAGIVSADAPSVALGVGALAVGSAAGRRPIWALAAGALLAAAILVKLLALPFAIALAVVAWRHDQRWRFVAWSLAGAAVVTVATAVAYVDQLGGILHDAVGFHLDDRRAESKGFGVPAALYSPLFVLSFAGLAGALAAGAFFNRAPTWRSWFRGRAPLVVLLASALAFVALQRPLYVHHLIVVTVPLALLAGSAWPQPRPVSIVAVGAIAFVAATTVGRSEFGRSLIGGQELREQQKAAAIITAHTRDHDTVVSDLPLILALADRTSPYATLDPSYARIRAGSLRRSDLLRSSDGAGAVVVGRAFTAFPDVQAELRRRHPWVVPVGRSLDVYLRGPPPARKG